MASGKHSQRKRKRKRPLQVSVGELLEQARRLLTRGDARGALERLKRVQDGECDPQESALLHFCAFIQRARELARMGQKKEASSMRARAVRHRASICAETLGEEDLVRYLRHLDGDDAVTVYASYTETGSSFSDAERLLADWLVIRRCWQALDVLDENHALRRDAGHVIRSLDAMDAGEWERASDSLRGLPRRSPFAAWRVFCKAMVCFGAGDDAGLRQALKLLPADFALADTVAELRRVSNGGGNGGSARTQQALGTDGSTVSALGNELRRALCENERPRVIEQLMSRLADALCPDDHLPALVDLVQIAGLATARDRLSMHTVTSLAQNLLPARRVSGLLARIGLVLQQVSVKPWDPGAALAFLGRLSVEFPRSEDQALARGRVFETLARTGHRTVPPELLPRPMVTTLSRLLEGRRIEPGTVFADLMEASLVADPDNREGYRFVVELLRGDKKNKDRLRRVLEDMAARFPEDAEPWLELTTLHYSANAYRRAEEALAEARRCVPHDERIVDLQAVGILKSSDQSRKNGRFEVASRDLLRAEALGRSRLEGIVAVKRLLLEVVSSGRDAAEVVAPHLGDLPPGSQIRTLVLLLHELERNSNVKNVRPEMVSAVRVLLANRAPAIDELDSDEAIGLLAPLPADLQVLYGDLHVAPVLSDWWAAIMRRQNDRLTDVFDILMDCGGRAAVRAEIDRRLSGTRKAGRDPLLLLYLAVIRYQEGIDRDSRRFVEVLNSAAASDRERLREGAARLARSATGILREALQSLDFGLLDIPEPVFANFLEELMDSVEAPPDERPWHYEFMDALKTCLGGESPDESRQGSLFGDEAGGELDTLESLISRYELRGVPSALLREVVDVVRTEPEIRRNLDRIARKCKDTGLRGGLTREARIFLFPREYRRRRRRRA